MSDVTRRPRKDADVPFQCVSSVTTVGWTHDCGETGSKEAAAQETSGQNERYSRAKRLGPLQTRDSNQRDRLQGPGKRAQSSEKAAALTFPGRCTFNRKLLGPLQTFDKNPRNREPWSQTESKDGRCAHLPQEKILLENEDGSSAKLRQRSKEPGTPKSARVSKTSAARTSPGRRYC